MKHDNFRLFVLAAEIALDRLPDIGLKLVPGFSLREDAKAESASAKAAFFGIANFEYDFGGGHCDFPPNPTGSFVRASAFCIYFRPRGSLEFFRFQSGIDAF